PAGTAADLVIINSCTVTGRAAMQSRQAIRQARRDHPHARIVVTGCYAQTAPNDIGAIEGVDLIIGHADKLALAKHLVMLDDDGHASPKWVHQPIDQARRFAPLPAVSMETRTRAFLKIQDGCNTRCTYCIVPYARGRSRSMPVADVLMHLERLAIDGFREVVLTGIHLGAFGLDANPPTNLGTLLSRILACPSIERIRLSSIEPTEVDEHIIGLIANGHGRLCRHLHIPLQSGDDDLLRRMGRPYTRDLFARAIHLVHRHLPEAAIGMDVMAGFPGETEKAFQRTVALVRRLPVSYLHVFPYSPRPGTPAADLDKKVPERITKARCRVLRHLGREKHAAFLNAMIGKELKVLIESISDDENPSARGLSDNYVQVRLPSAGLKKNDLITVRVERIEKDGTAIAIKERLSQGGPSH
ncbi:MAG: tRNA (N(6)-L-threonylcarbamoyladenosine(37)-C(2))-methylthiotransferase MtaB, partial [Desulfatitalea sp.]|nr:tRNA (N(6)-L-threonylcarbamoyladenosine(37)-C(2))-methylthiotransferase MtaB [Desulfatitalea sp.]